MKSLKIPKEIREDLPFRKLDHKNINVNNSKIEKEKKKKKKMKTKNNYIF
jgi:hypothetical protein